VRVSKGVTVRNNHRITDRGRARVDLAPTLLGPEVARRAGLTHLGVGVERAQLLATLHGRTVAIRWGVDLTNGIVMPAVVAFAI